MVKNRISKKKQNQARKENALIARQSKQQKANIFCEENTSPLIARDRAVKDFLLTMSIILSERFELLKAQTIIKPPTTRLSCHHVSAIGSSQIHKLMEGELDIKSLHERAYHPGARAEGSSWEDKWKKRKYFICNGKRHALGTQIAEPNRFSACLPWITASPDFISQVTCEKVTEWSVIEVKSTADPPNMEAFLTQVRVSMSCFGIETGYLVIYDANDEKACPQIFQVRGKTYLQNHAEALHEAYKSFIKSSLKTLFETRISAHLVDRSLRVGYDPAAVTEFDPERVGKGECRERACYYWSDNLVKGKIWKNKVSHKKKSMQRKKTLVIPLPEQNDTVEYR